MKKYCLTTRHDVYYFETLKELLDKWIPIAGLLGVRGWKCA